MTGPSGPGSTHDHPCGITHARLSESEPGPVRGGARKSDGLSPLRAGQFTSLLALSLQCVARRKSKPMTVFPLATAFSDW